MTAQFFFVDTAASGASHGTLQFGGSAPSVATMGTGAVLGTVHAANEFADMAYASIQPATAFTTTTGPTAGTGTTRCFRSASTISGSFAAGNWTIALAVIMSTPTTSGSAALRFRFYRGTSATGSGAQEITQTTQVSGNADISLGTQQNLSATYAANAITLENEYLFVEVGFEVLSGAVSITGATIQLVQDGTNSLLTTPAFTSPASTFYLLGTSQGTTGNPLGPDNSCDQVLAGGAWGQILPEATTNNGSDASAGIDPTTGIFYLFGNFDGANPAYTYNPTTHAYVTLGNLPSGAWGGGGCAYLNGVFYMVGGFVTGTGAGSKVVYSYSVSGASYSTSFTQLTTGVIDCPAIAVGSLIYHGGGDLGDGLGTPVTSWFKWDPISDTRTPLSPIPTARGGMAIAAIGDFIWIFGGYTTGSTNYQATTNVYRYTISTDTWTAMNPLPLALNYARACVFNGQIWIAGGITSAGFGAFTTNVSVYTPGTDSYASGGSLSTPIFGSVLGVSPPGPISGTASCSFSASAVPSIIGSAVVRFDAQGLLGNVVPAAPTSFVGIFDPSLVPTAWWDDSHAPGQPLSLWDEDLVQVPASGGAISGNASCSFSASATLSVSGNASCTFAASATHTITGNASCTFTATGAGAATGALTGNASCTFSASATPTIAGSASCTFSGTGTLAGAGALAGNASCTFSASGVPSIAGNASCTFSASATPAISGNASCTFNATGAATGLAALTGNASCTFSASGVPTIAGSSSCTFSASGIPSIKGIAACTFAATGTLVELVVGNASCTFNASATPTISGSASCSFTGLAGFQNFVAGNASCAFNATATPSIRGLASCTFNATSTPAMSGASACSFAASSTPSIAGSSAVSFTATGQLVELLIGQASCTFNASTIAGALTGNASCSFSATGQLVELMTGNATCSFDAHAVLTGSAALSGTAFCAFNAQAMINGFTGTASCSFDAFGVIMNLISTILPPTGTTRLAQLTLGTAPGASIQPSTSPSGSTSPSTARGPTSGGPRTRR